MARERKSRNSNLPVSTLLTPINILDFGDLEKDPCFGKHYDLRAIECQSCGDFEFCAIVYAQHQHKERLGYEKENPVKDLEISTLELSRNVRVFYKEALANQSRPRALKATSTRFNKKIILIKTIVDGY